MQTKKESELRKNASLTCPSPISLNVPDPELPNNHYTMHCGPESDISPLSRRVKNCRAISIDRANGGNA